MSNFPIRLGEPPPRYPMRRLLPASVRASAVADSASVIAVFDLEGKLLRASATYITLLRNRALSDDLLALPRSLTLRAACGYPPVRTGPLTARTVCIRGSDFSLRGRFIEPADGEDPQVALTLSAAPTGVAPHRSGPRLEPLHGSRRRRGRPRHLALPLRRMRAAIYRCH